MSTDADRTQAAHVPLPPVAPPRPTAPPRPGVPPAPRTAPRADSAASGDEPPAPRPSGPGAAPIPRDEPTARVTPRRRPREEGRSGGERGTGGGDRPAGRAPGRPAAPASAQPGPAEARRRPPLPTAPPQPPPPTGDPFTAPRRTSPPPPRVPPAPPAVTEDPLSGPPTFQLRPVRAAEPARPPLRTVAAVTCLVLGVGLLGGTAAGSLLTGDAEAGTSSEQAVFDEARGLWHSVPVDTLFPPTVRGERAGPGGADRRWTRVAVAADSTCAHAFDPLLTEAFSPVGCRRLVRATYADETSTGVTTVGILFTRADAGGMRKLRKRFAEENLTARSDLMPRPYAARGTVAAGFGDAQRASWTIRVLTEAPAVVYAVSGFADGRTVSDPQPAAEATVKGETSAAAQSGLGHATQGLADRIGAGLRKRLPDAETEDAS